MIKNLRHASVFWVGGWKVIERKTIVVVVGSVHEVVVVHVLVHVVHVVLVVHVVHVVSISKVRLIEGISVSLSIGIGIGISLTVLESLHLLAVVHLSVTRPHGKVVSVHVVPAVGIHAVPVVPPVVPVGSVVGSMVGVAIGTIEGISISLSSSEGSQTDHDGNLDHCSSIAFKGRVPMYSALI